MSQPNDCTHCVEWEICPFHPKPAAPPTEPTKFNLYRWVTECPGHIIEDPPYPANAPRPWARGVGIQGLRLLGPDDPEVSDDLIYLDDATGGVVGVPVTWEPTALAARRGRA